jgi:hypothetical protein
MGAILGILGVIIGLVIAGIGLWFGIDGAADMFAVSAITFWGIFWVIVGLLIMLPVGIWCIFALGAIGAVIDE